MTTAAGNDIILKIDNLSCGYGSKPVVEGFTLQVAKGDRIAITGPNGCGKSTLLKAIYQLCIINSGDILYKGISLKGKTPETIKKLGIAWFMQKNAVFAKLSVKENLLLALNGLDFADKNLKINEIIHQFPELANRINTTAGLLSGGQRQQLSFAMLLLQDADLWLLDEPTAGLDKNNTGFFVNTFENLIGKTRENSKTVIFVEHKTDAINRITQQIINLKLNK